jgi:hypothetical protein
MSDVKNNEVIKTAPSTLSSDRVRSLYNQNFLLLKKFIDSTKVEPPKQVTQLIFPANPVEGGTYNLKYQNGQWLVVRDDIGTQYRFTGNESLLVTDKHQHITYAQLLFEDNSSVVVESGGQLVVLNQDSGVIQP